MTAYSVPYGKNQITFDLPDDLNVDQLIPATLDPLPDPDQAIMQALQTPSGAMDWQHFQKAQSVGIAINDKTRPVPKPNPVYHLLTHLESLGFEPEQIKLFISSGTHAPMTPEEFPSILDQAVIDRYPIFVHDCDHSPMVNLGQSNNLNPILLNAVFYECDIKISVGNIEPHHFMGFSGGVKTAAIGLAGRDTIVRNHARLTHPQARSGVYHINPLRQEVEEIGRKAGIHFSLGTILDENKRILKVYFGEPTAVMNAGIPVVRELFGISVPQSYDLVIASPGGAPKDLNLYQSQKGLTHAARITRDGGWVVLLAACTEGSGSQAYETYIADMESNEAIMRHFQSGYFKVGPHKAMQIAKEAVRVNVILVSDLPPEVVKHWKITPSKPELINELLAWIVSKLSPDARVAVLPASTRTMTEVKK